MMATLIAHGLELQSQIAALRQSYSERRRARHVGPLRVVCSMNTAITTGGGLALPNPSRAHSAKLQLVQMVAGVLLLGGRVASLPRIFDLLRQRVEIDQEEVRQVVHLLGHFFRRVFVTMKRLVPIKAQFMSPLLDVLGDAMLVRELVDSLLKLPRFDFRGKGFERQLHGSPVHPASSIPRPSATRIRCFYIRAAHLFRHVGWSFQQLCLWPLPKGLKVLMRHQITRQLRCFPGATRSVVHEHADREMAAVAPRHHYAILRFIGYHVFAAQCERDLVCSAVRAVENQGIRHE